LATVKDEAAREGLNPDSMGKAHRAAQEFSAQEIAALCTAIERHQASFGATHLIRLLSVPPKQRQKLAHEAIQGRWSTTRLATAIRERYGRRRQGGRGPYVPAEANTRLVYLDELCRKWCRWCESASAKLPAGLRKPVEDATAAVKYVQQAGAKNLRKR
jgi:hypothetical protein